jgi:hypothetical protein
VVRSVQRRSIPLALAVALLPCGVSWGQVGPMPDPPTGWAAAESRKLGGAPGDARPGSRAHPAPGKDVASPSVGIGKPAWALAGVVGLIVAAGVAVQAAARNRGGIRAALGAGGRSPAGLLEIIGRYPVTRGATLVLLRLDRRVLLLSQSTGGRLGAGASFTTLCEVTDPEEIASILVKSRDAEGESAAEKFRTLLSKFDKGMTPDAVDHGSGRRRASSGQGGDWAELWDESRGAIPVVDLTIGGPGGGAIGALRRRLGALRGGGAA